MLINIRILLSYVVKEITNYPYHCLVAFSLVYCFETLPHCAGIGTLTNVYHLGRGDIIDDDNLCIVIIVVPSIPFVRGIGTSCGSCGILLYTAETKDSFHMFFPNCPVRVVKWLVQFGYARQLPSLDLLYAYVGRGLVRLRAVVDIHQVIHNYCLVDKIVCSEVGFRL
jgi:hypothetical protein